MSRGGLGFLRLGLQLRLRRVLETFNVVAGRAVYPRTLIKTLMQESIWEWLPGSDPEIPRRDLQRFDLTIVLDLAGELDSADVLGGAERPPTGPVILVVSDGSVKRPCLGFAVVLADEVGIFASCWSSAAVADPSLWTAECLGRPPGVPPQAEGGRPDGMLSMVLFG